MDQLRHLDARQRGRLPAEARPGRRGVDDRAGRVAERDEVVRAFDDEPTNGVVDALSTCRQRFRAAARGSAPQGRAFLVAVCTIPGGKARGAAGRLSALLLENGLQAGEIGGSEDEAVL